MYDNFSEKYYSIIDEYVDFHENGTEKLPPEKTFQGTSLLKWVFQINKIIKDTKSHSLIDFGCGKALGYVSPIKVDNKVFKNVSDFWEINNMFLYDPGVKKYSKYPTRKADGIICTDVIEHIPPQDIKNFINELYKLSNKFIFVVAATNYAQKTFKNGENVHLTIKTKDEWITLFKDFAQQHPTVKTFIEFNNN